MPASGPHSPTSTNLRVENHINKGNIAHHGANHIKSLGHVL